jgi:inner membrane protein involved in colicin E2 resistance
LLRQIAALTFIFLCTTVAWIILASTILYRTHNSDEQLKGRVGSTWGTTQEQAPPTAAYVKTEIVPSTTIENGRTIVRNENAKSYVNLPLESSRIKVNLNLDHRQKGLLWYSTYAVKFGGTYTFTNPTEQDQFTTFRLKFPADKAIYDDLIVDIDGKPVPTSNESGTLVSQAHVLAGKTVTMAVGYRSQGMDSWQYRLGSEVAQAKDFVLNMHTNFRDIDFAENTLSPTEKRASANGWDLTWKYSNVISGYEIGMTMPEKLQPGPLAGEISYFAPVSLLFFFFLMFIISTTRGIDLHPMNYFFLATAFFAFHLLLAYLVDHISIHLAFVICSLVSIFLVTSYLRLVVGPKFAFVEAGLAQLVYLVLFSYAFFFKGFTGLSVTIGAIVTLFVVMQLTAKVKWSDRFAAIRPPSQNPGNGESRVRG